jgi:hypothetical protein
MFSFSIKRTGDDMDRRIVTFTQGETTVEITLAEPAPEDPQAAFEFCMPKLIEAGLVAAGPFALRG